MHPRSLPDATLVARAATGDGDAFAELARRYAGLIRQTIRDRPFGLMHEDLRQEALIGLFEACRAYDPTRHRFGAVATVQVRHRVCEARKCAGRRKHRLLSEALRIDYRPGDDDRPTLADRLGSDHNDPARIVELREELRELATTNGRRDRRLRAASQTRQYGEADIATALELVAQGKTLREAGAAVGASHPTVMRWVRNAA